MAGEMLQDGFDFDHYVEERLRVEDDAVRSAAERSAEAGLPPIQVSAAQGKLLEILCAAFGARRVLEVGTLGGYSTIFLARGVGEGGQVVSLELDEHHAQVAGSNLEAAGVSDRVEIIVGAASDTLASLVADGSDSFDLFFIDADKRSNPLYVERALELSHPGSVILVDNVVRGGSVTNPDATDEDTAGVRAMFDLLHDNHRLDATAIQTLGLKGYDGFVIARVLS